MTMRFIDRYFYRPSFLQKLLSFALLPLSLLYGIGSFLRRKIGTIRQFPIPVVSIGNLIAGGSGKTPFLIEVAREYERVAVISRGYKRDSKGLLIVSLWGEILCTQTQAGDEAFLIARELKNASVIVCKDRIEAAKEAIKLGAKVIFLDDGFRIRIKKLNILLEPLLQPYFRFCMPSGIYRELPSARESADMIVREGKDYTREVSVHSPSERMLLLTAIANPARLDAFLPQVVGKITLSDHARFDRAFLESKMRQYNATSLLVTSKDEVKLLEMGFALSVLRLRLDIDSQILEKIRHYVCDFHQLKGVQMKLQKGDKAPQFTLKNADEIAISLQDLLSKTLILYFYPKDNTPGCTIEAQEFSGIIDKFNAKDCVVVGISPDSPQCHKGFIGKQNLKHILLSDTDNTIAKAYGAYGTKTMYGKQTQGIIRSTFIISRNGVIKEAFYNVRAKGHAQKVLETI